MHYGGPRFSRRDALILGLGGLEALALSSCGTGQDQTSVWPTVTRSPAPTASRIPSPAPTTDAATLRAWEFGVVGDGQTDDALALRALLNAAAAERATVILAPKSRLRLGSVVTVPSHTHLNGNGATLVNAVLSAQGRLLELKRATNVVIENLNLDGNMAQHAERTEQRHNLLLSGATDVRIDNVRSYNAKGDGLYIGDQSSGPSRNVSVTNSVFDSNYRQGMSITAVSGLTMTNCRFSNTSGTAPQAGVDIEPNTDDSVVEHMVFRGCVFTGNAGGGFMVYLRPAATATQTSGTFIGCSFSKNLGFGGVWLLSSRQAQFIGGHIDGNEGNGMILAPPPGRPGTSTDTSLVGVSISNNAKSGLLAATSYSGLTIANCVFDGNGKSQPISFFGVDSVPGLGSAGTRLRVTECTFRNMHGGIRTNSACSYVTLGGNAYIAVMLNESLADRAATRLRIDPSKGHGAPLTLE